MSHDVGGDGPDRPDHSYGELFSLATRLGHDGWIEQRVFEICGAAAQSSADDELAVWFDAVSRHHGWHAQLCRDRLPELAQLDPDTVLVAPGEGTVRFFDALAATVPDSPESVTGTRVAALATLDAVARVLLPVLASRHRRLVRSVPESSAASVRRWYGFMIADVTEELLSGWDLRMERLVVAMPEDPSPSGPDPMPAVSNSTSALDSLLVASRGLHH